MSPDDDLLVLIIPSDRENVVKDLHFVASHDAQLYFCRVHPSFALPESLVEIWSCSIFDKDDSEVEAEFSSSEWQALVAFDDEFTKLTDSLPEAVESYDELVKMPEWQTLMQAAKRTVELFPDVPAPQLPEESDEPKKPWVGEKRTLEIGETTLEFNLEEYWWSTELSLRCWGNNAVLVFLDIEDEDPTLNPHQLRVLESIVAQQSDYRLNFEQEYFPHYQSEIYGSVCSWSEEKGFYGVDELTPPISQPAELRPMCRDASIWIPYPEESEQDSPAQFLLKFECSWDEEHGVSVAITDWHITDFNAD